MFVLYSQQARIIKGNVMRKKKKISKLSLCCTCVTQPFLQQRLELAHVFEAQVESLEARYCGLAEIIPVQFSHGKAHISLW